MKSLRRSHIVVVGGADSPGGQFLAARLRRMMIKQVTTVADFDEARRVCRAGGVDACLVVLGDAVPDAIAEAQGVAPAHSCGIPTLVIAPVVTPHLRRTARRCGYLAALPARIPPRMLYRRISAALQGHRSGPGPRRASGHMPPAGSSKSAAFSKPTVH
jgi:hypothetical protein